MSDYLFNCFVVLGIVVVIWSPLVLVWGGYKLIVWLRDRGRWLKWFSWN